MDQDTTLDMMYQYIQRSATGYAGLVARGDITARLAGVLFRRYADGIQDTAAGLFGLSATNQMGELIDRECGRLDPLWRETRSELSAARPADVSCNRRIGIPQLDRPNAETRVSRARAVTSRIRLDDDEH